MILGEHNYHVTKLQKCLEDLGYLFPGAEVEGTFTEGTEIAVYKFRLDYGIAAGMSDRELLDFARKMVDRHKLLELEPVPPPQEDPVVIPPVKRVVPAVKKADAPHNKEKTVKRPYNRKVVSKR